MTDQPLPAEPALRIHTPCPMSWDDLKGDDKKRFCSQCSLHVLDAAHLSQGEAQALVANATARVCMRMQLDSSGAPIFRDSEVVRAEPVAGGDRGSRRPRHRIARMAQWALSAAAGVLAACTGSTSGPAPNDPGAVPITGETPTRMGKVCTTAILGDVAPPTPPPPLIEMMGEAVVAPAPTPAPAPAVPPEKRDE